MSRIAAGVHCHSCLCVAIAISLWPFSAGVGFMDRGPKRKDWETVHPLAPEDIPHTLGANCSDARSPKVAVCVSGAARTMVKPEVYGSFATHVLQGTPGRGLRRSQKDVFVHVKLGDSPNKRQGRKDVDFDPMVSLRGDVQTSITAMQATASEIVDGEGPYEESKARALIGQEGCFSDGFYKSDNHLARAMNQYWSVHEVFKLMEEEERASGERYDVVIFLRPDLRWNESIPSGIIACNRATFQKPAMDWSLILPRETASLYGRLFPDNFGSASPQICHPSTTEKLVESVMGKASRRGLYVDWGTLRPPVMRPDGTMQSTR